MTFEDASSSNRGGTAAAPTPTVSAPEPPKPETPLAPAVPSVPPQIEDFDALIKGEVQNFVDLGGKIGGLVADQVSPL